MANLIPPAKSFATEDPAQQDWSEMLMAWLLIAKVFIGRFWWLVLVTISLGLAIQAYRILSSPTQYISGAQMIVSGRITLPEGSVYSEELANFFGTQITLMNSEQVQARALARVESLRPDLKPTKVKVSVKQALNTSVFLLQAVGLEPVYTQAYLDAVMHEYLGFRRQMRTDSADRSFLALNEEVIDLQGKIEEGENEKVEFQKENNMIFIQQQGEQLGNYLSELSRELSDAQTQLRFIESLKIDSLSNAGNETASVNFETLGVGKDFLESKEKLNQLKAEYDECSGYMKDNHPRLLELKQRIDYENNLLLIYRRQSLARIKEKQEAIKARIENLTQVIADQQVYALDYSRRMAEFERLNSRLDRQKKMLEQRLASLQAINLNLNVDQESVYKMQDATPAVPADNNLLQQLLVGAFLGFFIGIAIIILIAIIDLRIISIEDISRRFEEPVMGVVPWQDKNEAQEGILQPNDKRFMLAEACRNIRSSLLFSTSTGENFRMIAVTSSVPSEGKSMLASQLAVTFAFTSAKVLLIDADLRRGRQHGVFDLPQSPGLAEFLKGEAELSDIIHKDVRDGLDVIMTGHYPENPGELLMSAECNQFLINIRKKYDYIIFDTAPILASDDTPALATKVDGVLFVVRSGFSRVRQVQLSIQNLLLRQVKLCGFVLNGFDTKGMGSYYYKYRSYYGHNAPGTPSSTSTQSDTVEEKPKRSSKAPFDRAKRAATVNPIRRRTNTKAPKADEPEA